MKVLVTYSSTLFLFLANIPCAMSQSATPNTSYSDSTETKRGIKYTESSSIKQLMESYTDYHKDHPQLSGYRIEIFSSSGANSKLRARNTRLKFQSSHDSIPAYVVWEYPNFEVRVGDYRTKLEAEAALEEITTEFPFAFITKDQIELPALITESQEKEQE